MEDKQIEENAKKYRHHQHKLINIISIIIIIAGIIFTAGGVTFIIISKKEVFIYLGIIMIVAGILDILLAFKFRKFAHSTIDNMTDIEADKRYKKIYGIK